MNRPLFSRSFSKFSRFSLRHPLKNISKPSPSPSDSSSPSSSSSPTKFHTISSKFHPSPSSSSSSHPPTSSPTDTANSRVVAAALLGNLLVCGVKGVAAYVTSSGVLLAETFHSLADVVNQTLLMIGIRSSLRHGDALHPYGYGPLKPAFALISATGVFFLGCGASVFHGVHQLLAPEAHASALQHIPVGLAVIGSSLAIEGVTCYYAYRKLRELARIEGFSSVWEYLRKGRETTSIAVFVEDAFAVGGLLVAGTTLGLTQTLGSPLYDSVGTVVIGASMGMLALFLINRNLQSLLGYRLDNRTASSIAAVLNSTKAVRSVHDVKTLTYGPRSGRFKAEIEYDGRELARKYLHDSAQPQAAPSADPAAAPLPRPQPLIAEYMARCTCSALSDQEKEELLLRFGSGVVNELAIEVDRVETEIKRTTGSAVRHVDLESHASHTLLEDSQLSQTLHEKISNMSPHSSSREMSSHNNVNIYD